MTPENFGRKSLLRNPTIGSLLHRIDYIEKMGTGISRMREALKEAKLPPPKFDFDSFFTVTLKRPVKRIAIAVGDVVADGLYDAIREGVVGDAVGDAVDDAVKRRLGVELLYLCQKKSLVLQTVRTIFEVSRPTAQRDLALLKSSGLVAFKGSPRRGKYILTPKGDKLFKLLTRR